MPSLLLDIAQPVCPAVPKLTAYIHEGDHYKTAFFVGFFCMTQVSGVTVKSVLQRPKHWDKDERTTEAAFDATIADARALHPLVGNVCVFASHTTHHGSEWNELVLFLTDTGEWKIDASHTYLFDLTNTDTTATTTTESNNQ